MALNVLGYHETGYLSPSAAGVPLLMRELTAVRHQSDSVAAVVVLGLRSALHTDGLLRRVAARGQKWDGQYRSSTTFAGCAVNSTADLLVLNACVYGVG